MSAPLVNDMQCDVFVLYLFSHDGFKVVPSDKIQSIRQLFCNCCELIKPSKTEKKQEKRSIWSLEFFKA